jgi:RNA binding exosome subunit
MSSKILTQIPRESRNLLFDVEIFKEHFGNEIKIIQGENEYKEHIKAILK